MTSNYIKVFECCGKIIHFSCYENFINSTANKNCPNCRQLSSEITINRNMPLMNLFFDDFNYRPKVTRTTCTNPIYCDESNNIIIRHTLFINKYKIQYHSFMLEYNYLSYITIIAIICDFSMQNFDRLDYTIDRVFYESTSSNKSFFEPFIKHIVKISRLLNFNKTIELQQYIDNFINKPLKTLLESNKQKFPYNLKVFFSCRMTFYWFNFKTINEKREIYDRHFTKIIGEKFRNIIVSNDFDESVKKINLYLHKH